MSERPTPLVEFIEVSHAVDRHPLLQEIDWQIMPHTHWAVLGPNGAGKTTLIRILAGGIWPNAGGTILRNGVIVIEIVD
ncbi:MAG: ATP-binding cassette domain-containing protein, partial [Planctomycetota bacterium]